MVAKGDLVEGDDEVLKDVAGHLLKEKHDDLMIIEGYLLVVEVKVYG